MTDTRQQQAVLRQCATARRVRQRYGAGTQVIATVSGMRGVVERHIPMTNAQGGVLVVRWENGHQGRISPINVEVIA